MAEIARQGKGMVLVLGGHEDEAHLLRRIQQQPEPSMLGSGDNRQSRELRTYGIGAQIIFDIGIRKMRVLSAPKHMTGLAGFGLEVVEYVECEPDTDVPDGK
jgi:3,4-dihydroxy 2-butanone 4-phosphate synthase/GTP cyclohydrolase II